MSKPEARLVVFHGDVQGAASPNQHHEFLRPCYTRVKQISLQEHIMLRVDRYHHRRVFRALRFMDRYGVSVYQFVEFLRLITDRVVIEFDRYQPGVGVH